MGGLPDLAAEPDLTEDGEPRWKRTIDDRGHDGEGDGEIDTGLGETDTAHG